ncbi:MAG: ABC transporter permease, partial [Proteobacteria bacterium]|nr:ABC transporter permease [Pseudomonadota bacterium]
MASYDSELRRRRVAAWIQIIGGILIAGAGTLASFLTYNAVATTGGTYYVFRGAIVTGVVMLVRGIWRLMAAHDRPVDLSMEERGVADVDRPAASFTSGLGYKGFVAWRYLLDRRRYIRPWVRIAIVVGLGLRAGAYFIWGDGVGEESFSSIHGIFEIALCLGIAGVLFWGILRFSKPSMVMFLLGAVVGVGALLAVRVVKARATGVFDMEDAKPLIQTLNIVALAGWGLAGLATFFGTVRAIFTFFTTVPIGGVWIGTGALVCVLSVMSGFESDLREKILGSNAHLQITKEEGDFVEWHDMKARIDKIPGVVASTPYAISEVVVAANNNGMNVIIKGIDPATVGKVTDLVEDIEAPTRAERVATMQRLE